MGYYVCTTGGSFTVPPENMEAAYAAVCALNDHDDLKGGGSYGGDFDANSPRPEGASFHNARWYSWMPADFPSKLKTLREVFEELGFVCDDDNGALRIECYDCKMGQEELFLAAIAPFCDRDSSFEWRGEDGSQWRHTISDAGQLLVWDSEVVYHSPRAVGE